MTTQCSKRAIAGQIYREMTERQIPRKQVVEAMVKDARLTVSGANTYYSNFKSGQWKIGDPIELVRRPDYAEMDNDQLLKFFNDHSEVKLHAFASRDDAIVMIENYVINV